MASPTDPNTAFASAWEALIAAAPDDDRAMDGDNATVLVAAITRKARDLLAEQNRIKTAGEEAAKAVSTLIARVGAPGSRAVMGAAAAEVARLNGTAREPTDEVERWSRAIRGRISILDDFEELSKLRNRWHDTVVRADEGGPLKAWKEDWQARLTEIDGSILAGEYEDLCNARGLLVDLESEYDDACSSFEDEIASLDHSYRAMQSELATVRRRADDAIDQAKKGAAAARSTGSTLGLIVGAILLCGGWAMGSSQQSTTLVLVSWAAGPVGGVLVRALVVNSAIGRHRTALSATAAEIDALAERAAKLGEQAAWLKRHCGQVGKVEEVHAAGAIEDLAGRKAMQGQIAILRAACEVK